MKKLGIIGLSLILATALSACGNEKEVSVSKQSSNQEVTSSTKEEVKKESAVGKRSNPVPLGETATFDTTYYNNNGDAIDANLSITLSNIVRGQEAYDYLLSANEFNEAAPEGQEWVIFDVDLKMNKGSMDDPYYETGFLKPVASSGQEIAQSVYPTFKDDEAFGSVDIYEGGTSKGKAGVTVPVGEEFLVEYSGNDFDTSVFFNMK